MEVLSSIAKKPAWFDDDDEKFLVKDKEKELKYCHRSVTVQGKRKYAEFVQEKFTKNFGQPNWAEIGRNVDNSDEYTDEKLRKTDSHCVTLPKNVINFKKCGCFSNKNIKGAIVKSVEFLPAHRVALVAGTNGVADLYQVDGKLNEKIQSIYFDDFKINSAHFSPDSRELIACAKWQSYFNVFDLMTGKIRKVPLQKGMEQRCARKFRMSPDGKWLLMLGRYGYMHLMTGKSKEWVGSLKMNGEVVAVDFSRDGSKLYSHGTCGEVYIWDVNSRKCVKKFTDEGCLVGTAIAASPNNQFLATGSDSGIVNIYDMKSSVPLKVVKNITTEITSLRFNGTSELLAIGSSFKAEAVKLVHVRSLTAFSNFPGGESVKHVNSVDFSPNSGYLLLGNNFGNALLYRLKHYESY